MRPETKQRMDALLSSGARPVIETFLEELLDEKRLGYDSCNRDTFDVHKGEVLAIRNLLNYVRGTSR